jgi:hypothetical protein
VQNELHLPLASVCGCGLVFLFYLPFSQQRCFLLSFFLGNGFDSPLLSTLVAQNAPAEIKGTTLTIVNSIGFAITIISIQLISGLRAVTDTNTIYICYWSYFRVIGVKQKK